MYELGLDRTYLGADGGLDNGGVEGVRDEGDDNIGLLEGLVKSSGIVDIKGDSLGVLEAAGESLGALEGTAGFYSSSADWTAIAHHIEPLIHTDGDLDVSLAENLNSGLGN